MARNTENRLQVFFIILFIIFLLLITKKIWLEWLKELALLGWPSDPDRIGNAFGTILTALGGIALFLGLWFSFRRAKAMEDNVANQTRQLEQGRKSQVDEQFKSAIEHLGNENEAIAFGGIATLIQIAKDNAKDYAEVIGNILSTYVRNSTSFDNPTKTKHSALVQYIIGGLFGSNESPFSEVPINLSKCDLFNYDFEKLVIKKADFSGSVMPDFFDTKCSGVNFHLTKWYRVRARNSQFLDCDMSFLRGIGCSFDKVQIKNCDMLQHLMIDSEFHKCLWSNHIEIYSLQLVSSDIVKSIFSSPNATSCNFTASAFTDVTFDLDQLSTTSFEAVAMHKIPTQVRFKSCSFNGAQVPGQRFRNISQLFTLVGRKPNFDPESVEGFIHERCEFNEYLELNYNGLAEMYQELTTKLKEKLEEYDIPDLSQ